MVGLELFFWAVPQMLHRETVDTISKKVNRRIVFVYVHQGEEPYFN